MSTLWIEASAGTGKTYTLVQQVVDWLSQGRWTADQIVLVTFTEKATDELKTRLRARLREEAVRQPEHAALNRALEDLPRLTVTTIHGFCRALLAQFPLEAGLAFSTELIDQSLQSRRRLRERWRDRLDELDSDLLALSGWTDPESWLDAAVQALKHEVLDRPVLHPTPAELERFHREWQALKAGTGPLWDQVRPLAPVLGDDAKATFGPEVVERHLHGKTHKLAFEGLQALADTATVEGRLALLDGDTLGYLRRWGEGTPQSVWKQRSDPAATPALAAAVTSARAASQALDTWAAGLPDGVAPQDFLRRCARFVVLRQALNGVPRRGSPRELSFGDMIGRVADLVASDPEGPLVHAVRDRWKAALIDEFQDTDRTQWQIFRCLFGGADQDLLLVGDPKQAIYRFRGADLSVYRQARDEVKAGPHTVRTLEVNYRSTPAMIAAVNTVARQLWKRPDEFPDARPASAAVPRLVRRRPGVAPLEPEPLEVRSAADAPAWYRGLAARALDLLDGTWFLQGPEAARPLRPDDLLVLCRSHAGAAEAARRLSAKGLPATLGGTGGLFRSAEAGEVLLFLKALERPRDVGTLRALAWTRLFAGIALDRLATALGLAAPEAARGNYVGAFRRAQTAVEPGVRDPGGLEAWLGRPGGLRLVTNVEHLLELLQERAAAGLVLPGRAALALELWRESGASEDEISLRRDDENPAIRVLTIHAAKGLEAPVVLHGWQGRKPPRGDVLWYAGPQGVDFLLTDEGKAEEDAAEDEQEANLKYVALTRAAAWQLRPAEPEAAALALEHQDTAAWNGLPRWRAAPEAAATFTLAPPLPGLDRRFPWVESHSGLWKRSSLGQAPHRTVWEDRRPEREDEPSATDAVAVPDTETRLPAGPAFGDLVHDVLESADLRDWAAGASPEARRRRLTLAEAALASRRSEFPEAALAGRLDRWLEVALGTPLTLNAGVPPLDLTNLGPEACRREAEFHLPLRSPHQGRFRWDGQDFLIGQGFLTGRIDLLFTWQGGLYLADWKTNLVDPGADLQALMRTSGYDLQAQWYWEALTRLCRLDGGGLTPRGVLYVFLRGDGERARSVFLSPAELDARQNLKHLFREDAHA